MATAEAPGTAGIQARWTTYEWGSFESGNPNECYERPLDILAEAICDVLAIAVDFTTVSLVDTNRSAEFSFNVATLNIRTDTGPSACGGDIFWIRARFNLPQFSADCCSGPDNFIKLEAGNQFTLLDALFFEDESHRTGFVDIKLRRVNNAGTSNKVNIHISGRYGNGEKYRGLGVVRLTCP